MDIVTGCFITTEQAFDAVEKLRDQGFNGEVTVLGGSENENNYDTDAYSDYIEQGISMLPTGLAPLITQGISQPLMNTPMTGLFLTSTFNGLVGKLAQRGVPPKVGIEIKKVIKDGNSVVIAECQEHEKWGVKDIMERSGAQKIHM